MKYETRHQKLASPDVFHRRILRSAGIGLGMVVVSLAVGMTGYAYFESESLLDAFLSASMILSGMGSVNNPQTVGGKLFAGIYAIYSGFAVLLIAGVMFAPVIHRIMHRFHLATEEDEDEKEKKDKKGGKDKPERKR